MRDREWGGGRRSQRGGRERGENEPQLIGIPAHTPARGLKQRSKAAPSPCVKHSRSFHWDRQRVGWGVGFQAPNQ